MNTSIATFTKLLLTFVSSFGVAFAGISIAMGNRLNVELDWSILANDAKIVQQELAHEAKQQLLNVAEGFVVLAEEKPIKTLIYTSPVAADDPDLNSDAVSTAPGQPQQQLVHFQGKIIAQKQLADPQSETAGRLAQASGIIDGSNLPEFIYYNQHDARWKDYRYGGSDPIDKYGCGPTVLAMLLANTSKRDMTPEKAADWATEFGYYAKNSGSYHGIIRDGAIAFGLDSAAYKSYDEQSIRQELQKGHLFAALMKNGTFSTGNGHFLLILGLDEEGRAIIADSNSIENTQKTWALSELLQELKYGANDGGPLWIIRTS